jgi:hypothetical protein
MSHEVDFLSSSIFCHQVAKIDPNKTVCWQPGTDISHVNNIPKRFSMHLLSNLMKDVSNKFFDS